MTLPDNDPRHGTTNGYTNCGCRCHPCVYANTLRMRELRRKYYTNPLPEWVQHGTTNAYQNYGCRCGECRRAEADASRRSYHNLKARRGFGRTEAR